MEAVELYTKVHEHIEGRYELDSLDLYFIHAELSDIKRLKEKEIRGDRMICDLEHQKTVLTVELKKARMEIERLNKIISDSSFPH